MEWQKSRLWIRGDKHTYTRHQRGMTRFNIILCYPSNSKSLPTIKATMPRNKKKPTAAEIKLSQAARKGSLAQNEQLPPQDSPPHQPSPPPPSKASFNNIKEQLQAARKVDEDELIFLRDEDIKRTHHDIWQRMGFYSDHPNHNATAMNEAYTESMMKKSNKLGKTTAKYRLFMNKPTGKRTMLMQYPNRKLGQEYRAASGNKPLEIRIKPKCGLVEVDIPVAIHENYNNEKGVVYGEAIRKSKVLQEGGSYSLGGGLGIGPPRPFIKPSARAPTPEGPSHEKLLENIDDANNKGHVMNKITLGGQIHPFKSGDPIYMAATFKEGEFTMAGHHRFLS